MAEWRYLAGALTLFLATASAQPSVEADGNDITIIGDNM